MQFKIGLMCGLLLIATPLSAQQTKTQAQVVKDCVREVNQTTNNVEPFDAFVTIEGKVTSWSTAKERFYFEKCLNNQGWALDGWKK